MKNPEQIVGSLDFSGNLTIRETIYRAIKQSIIDGKLAVGERIVEKTFADAFRVSRTPVREALRRLETEGHVEYIPRTGVIVSGVTKQDVIEVYKIRKALEALVIEQASQNIEDEDIEKLKQYIQIANSDVKSDDLSVIMEHYESFNDILLRVSDMSRISAVLGQIKEYVFRFRRISASKEMRRQEVANEHEGIVKAIIEKDIEEAIRLNNIHLDNSLNTILNELFND
jgi:DNA-binding GntR family transcriptional regulator